MEKDQILFWDAASDATVSMSRSKEELRHKIKGTGLVMDNILAVDDVRMARYVEISRYIHNFSFWVTDEEVCLRILFFCSSDSRLRNINTVILHF